MATTSKNSNDGGVVNSLVAALRDPVARSVAIRLTVASTLAMAIATALSFQYPWWAAMAVWMVGQPPRGLLFERSLAQLVGTLLGAAAGAGLALIWPANPAIAVLGLVAWIALCCGGANAMRHQRAYGAALCGLTSAVIVSLTLMTPADPLTFASARAVDNVIGIGSAILVALAFGPPGSGPTIGARARSVTSQALALIAEALSEPGERSLARERAFLLSLAALEASAEDAAAGSLAARRKLRELNALFASHLDLIVVARAIRSREASELAPGHADMVALQEAFRRAAAELAADRDLDIGEIHAASQRLEAADVVLSPVLEEMRALLARTADHFEQIGATSNRPASHWSTPHPDAAGLRRAMLRGALASLVAGALWLSIGWEPLRYLMLGSCIFTVLFSMVDEPAPVVRQILAGGLCAAVAALIWRVAVLPEVANGWFSLAFAVPLMLGASLLQARQGTVFLGLAFNMLFAILARPVDTHPGDPVSLVAIEVMLLCGIALSYIFYRWLLPMDTQRRRQHLRAAIRREIASISIRAATPWAGRHLARLRYLVLSLATRSRGQVQEVEDALAALSLGHVLFRLGDMRFSQAHADIGDGFLRRTLHLTSTPMDDPLHAGKTLHDYAARLNPADTGDGFPDLGQTARLKWLLELAAQDLLEHASIFVSPGAQGRQPPSIH
ncbi:FUSC family protein [Xanthobacter autotrophicus]|uniref:FUSC family protein n=1 Tax=Xanthobacter autotrophicus TaxID=280 RepID=UPI00372CCBF9